ncbi:MAG: sugar phosphate isomerase/epimerase [Actinobacteria bacterium]|nr:sugar phosphate isomerase/epimerase [Actinomycetota bacterium]
MGGEFAALAPFAFGVVSNEISDDVGRVVDVAQALGMTRVEVASLWGTPVTEAGPDLLARAKRELERTGLRANLVISSAFKSLVVKDASPANLAAIPSWDAHWRELEGGVRAAQALGCDRIRVFSGRRDTLPAKDNPSPRHPDGGELPDDRLVVIVALLHAAAARAQAAGVALGVENVRSCWGNSARNTARIMAAVAHPAVGIVWDPANDFVSGGRAGVAEYELVKPWLVDVHLKDARVRDAATGLTSWEAIGRGSVDVTAQLRALLRGGYRGVVSLETHWTADGQTKEQNSRVSFAGLQAALHRARMGL